MPTDEQVILVDERDRELGVAGKLRAHREAEAARRRLREEMSLDCELRRAFEFVYRAELDGALVEHEYDHVFVGTHDAEPAPDPAEVEGWRWVSMGELRRGLSEEPESYSYWLKVAVEGEHWRRLEALAVGLVSSLGKGEPAQVGENEKLDLK
ncbi:MAG: NUDIX domain-containing protein [Acidobacteria bacterium]|nr:NUDIX domain-containing protein [Acidobacteriota bacterium]MCA1618395.1 NUDIX domain-containing protein [Acidobacteriota bacterium]